MTIGFLHVDGATASSEFAYLGARALVQSIRQCMLGTRIVQFSDLTSRVVKGVDAVRRKPAEPMGLLRLRHCAGVEGAWIFVDTDMMFQKNVRPVFKSAFDVALTTRDWSHLKPASGFSERMPYNTGIVFSRNPHFWGECYTRLRDLDSDAQHFMGEQQVINQVAEETHRYHVKKLPGSVYNYPPPLPGPTPEEREAQAAVLHYKGADRKALLMQRIRGEAQACA